LSLGLLIGTVPFKFSFKEKSFVFCEKKDPNEGDDLVNKLNRALGDIKTMDDVVGVVGDGIKKVFEGGIPSQITWGFSLGFCAGYSMKKASKLVAILFGATFVLIQSLSYSGFIDVSYLYKIEYF